MAEEEVAEEVFLFFFLALSLINGQSHHYVASAVDRSTRSGSRARVEEQRSSRGPIVRSMALGLTTDHLVCGNAAAFRSSARSAIHQRFYGPTASHWLRLD